MQSVAINGHQHPAPPNKQSLPQATEAFLRTYKTALSAEKQAAKAADKAAASRIEAAKMLQALRQRVEAGEAGKISWWTYFEKFVKMKGLSKSNAETLLTLASADDPAAAWEAEKASTRMRVSTHRAKQRQGKQHATGTPHASPPAPTPVLPAPATASAVQADVRRNDLSLNDAAPILTLPAPVQACTEHHASLPDISPVEARDALETLREFYAALRDNDPDGWADFERDRPKEAAWADFLLRADAKDLVPWEDPPRCPNCDRPLSALRGSGTGEDDVFCPSCDVKDA